MDNYHIFCKDCVLVSEEAFNQALYLEQQDGRGVYDLVEAFHTNEAEGLAQEWAAKLGQYTRALNNLY